MNKPARDDDQPGLWPMAQPADTAKADPNRRKSDLAALGQQRTQPQPTRPIRALNERNLWSIDDVADYLGVPKQTIYAWRKKNYGPPAIRVGKHLRWTPATVVAWVKQQERSAG